MGWCLGGSERKVTNRELGLRAWVNKYAMLFLIDVLFFRSFVIFSKNTPKLIDLSFQKWRLHHKELYNKAKILAEKQAEID